MDPSTEHRHLRLIESLGDACLVVDRSGTVVAANASAICLYDHALTGSRVADLCPTPERDSMVSEIVSCNGRPRSFRAIQQRRGGSVFVGEFSAKTCHEPDDDCVFLIVREAGDSTPAFESDLTLRTLMLNHVTDGIVCHTLDGELLFANRAALANWGMADLEEARALGPFGWVADTARAQMPSRMAALAVEREMRFESHGIGPRGAVVHLEINSSVIDAPGGMYVVSSVRDISNRMETEEMMRYLAYHDMLTGLANRVLLQTELAHALSLSDRHGDIVGVVFLDLNDFKPVNDTYGHAIGDHVLREVADRLSGAVRESDTVARPGGDEFVVLLPRLSSAEALPDIARKLAEEINRPIVIGNTTVQVFASVGIAVHRRGEDAESLLTRADLAMYDSRQDGVDGWDLPYT